MIDLIHQEALKQFRKELFTEGILHEGDTIGTNDETLLCVKIGSLDPHLKARHFISVGFFERVDLTWSNPRECFTIVSNGGRL